MLSGTAKPLKNKLKNGIKSARARYAQIFRSYGPEQLLQFLRDLGIRNGDALIVHSSYDAFMGFSGKPTDVIAVLEELVSHKGMLMMPTMPFTGTAVEYATRHPKLDLARTPSRMGLLSELFRRSRGVVRSAHPTHPIAAWGEGAEAVAAGHHRAATPCGRGSPFEHLLRRKGKVLFLGTDITSLTFYHWIEEALESKLPESPFTAETFELLTRLEDGTELATRTRLFAPAVSRRRNLNKLVPELKRINGWREARIGNLNATLIDAEQTLAAATDLAARAIYCYD